MEVLMDPGVLAGLATLIVLELVLGIDNLVFVAIMAGKLPAHQRDRARVLGLTLALAMRLALLAGASKLIAMKDPVVTMLGRGMSWRDIVLFCGGLFLLVKATREIHSRLEGDDGHGAGEKRVPSFLITIVQIVVLDAIFSADAIITAVGMVEHLWVMMAAVVISMAIMIATSKPLTEFVSRHPTVIILCLCFLLLIGCSLMAEGVGLHFPKTYLYVAIGFSLLIEMLNQIGGWNRRKAFERIPLRTRTADAIMRLMSTGDAPAAETGIPVDVPVTSTDDSGLHDEERTMIEGVISLGDLPIRRIMTVRPDVVWISRHADLEHTRRILLESGRTRVIVCEPDLDSITGVIEVKNCLSMLLDGEGTDMATIARRPLYVQESMNALQLIRLFRRHDERFAIVIDQSGTVEGVVTPMDIFAAIAGDLADDDDDDGIQSPSDGTWLVDGTIRWSDVAAVMGVDIDGSERDYETVAGHVLHIAERLPAIGDAFVDDGYSFRVEELDGRRIARVRIERMAMPE